MYVRKLLSFWAKCDDPLRPPNTVLLQAQYKGPQGFREPKQNNEWPQHALGSRENCQNDFSYCCQQQVVYKFWPRLRILISNAVNT